MSDLIKREDAIKAVFGLTMYKGRVPVNSVIFNIKKIPTANAKMSKYIERSKAKDEIVRVLEHTDCKDEYIDRVLMAISALPTIEVSAVPTISKMEQVDKDINVRSKDEPTTKTETQNSNSSFEKQTDCGWGEPNE